MTSISAIHAKPDTPASGTRAILRSLATAACLILTAAVLIPQAQATMITLSGATAFNANSDGSWNNAGITGTGGCCQNISVEPDTFTGFGNAVLPLTLALGTDVLYLESSDWTAFFGVTTGSVNLFFDGNLSPNISASTTTTYDQTSATTFAVIGSGLSTASLSDASIDSANSLSYDDGTDTVTITGLQWVGGSGTNPYSASQTVQRVTLLVTADGASTTPEPGSLLMIAAGLTALGIIGRKRQ